MKVMHIDPVYEYSCFILQILYVIFFRSILIKFFFLISDIITSLFENSKSLILLYLTANNHCFT